MLTAIPRARPWAAISRYGARYVAGLERIVADCGRRGELVHGPHVREFEEAMAARLGGGQAVATSYGRMAFYYIARALELPAGSEVVFPALTFWVVPEMARAAGLCPVFADVDPVTFNIDPASLERVISPRTRAVVPTHIYGLPCDMDEILAIAGRHHLRVIEDCAHALGATYGGRPVGTLGDAALFSFQLLKPVNTFGGGMAFTRDPALATRIATLAAREPWPTEDRVLRRLRLGRIERLLTQPVGFTLTGFPLLWAASWIGARPDVYMWEKIRPLTPQPPGYHERYSNVQAAIGIAALEQLDAWTAVTRAHAHEMTRLLGGCRGLGLPPDPGDRVHVYYQYPVYVPDRDAMVRRCLRRGVDVEYHHMDVCSDLSLFGEARVEAPGARRTMDAVQLPIHVGLSEVELERVARTVREALLTAASEPIPASSTVG